MYKNDELQTVRDPHTTVNDLNSHLPFVSLTTSYGEFSVDRGSSPKRRNLLGPTQLVALLSKTLLGPTQSVALLSNTLLGPTQLVALLSNALLGPTQLVALLSNTLLGPTQLVALLSRTSLCWAVFESL
jgi:hypothetical protein